MANLFEIALINPVRLIEIDVVRDDRYYYPQFDSAFSHDLIPDFKNPACYFQKFTRDDTTKIQILSDFTGIEIDIFDLNTGYIAIPDIDVTEVVSTIVGQTFKVYEAAFDFSLLDEGEYYIELRYVNELLEPITYQSEPLCIRDIHENTILLEYTHSENDYSVVFKTGIEFCFRVEAAVMDFKPEADKEVYNDQTRNTTQLSAVPYRGFTAYFGDAGGIPDWVSDKLNRVLSCDSVKYDGEYYQTVSGAKWEAKRAEDWPFTGWTIEVTPVENKYLQQLIIGDDPLAGGFTPVQKVLKYLDNGIDLTISNTFKKYTLLEKIYIIRSGGTYTLNIGTTPGGDEIGSFFVEDTIKTLNINHGFSAPATVYLTGLDASTNDIVIMYKQLDEAEVSFTPGPGVALGKGAVMIYEEVEDGDLEIDFNLTSGLGNPDTDWDGWAICDGRNGTQDRGGVFPIGYKSTGPFSTIGGAGGSETFSILSTDNLPEFHVKLFANSNNPAGGDTPTTDAQVARASTMSGGLAYELHRSTSPATLGKSSSVGKATPDAITHIPKYIVSLWVKKIA